MFYKMWPYVEREKPSPYLLEYVYNLVGFALWLIGGSIVTMFLGLLGNFPIYEGPIVALIFTFLSLIWYFLADRAGWLYLIDKRKGLIETARGRIWDFPNELVLSVKQNGDYDIDPNKVYVFYEFGLNALRCLLYYRQEGEEVRPYGRIGRAERETKTKDGKKLKFVRLVISTPKMEILLKFVAIDPPLEIEMVY